MAEQISKAIVLKIIDSSTNENDSFVDFLAKMANLGCLQKELIKLLQKIKQIYWLAVLLKSNILLRVNMEV